MVSTLKFWIAAIVVAITAALGGAAVFLWKDYAAVREERSELKKQVTSLSDLRMRDARIAKSMIEQTAAEVLRLSATLQQLTEVNDEDGVSYLDTPVPDSVRRIYGSP